MKKISSIIIASCLLITLIPSIVFASPISKGEVVDLVNKERKSRGLNRLEVNSKLTSAAQNKANDMIGRDYWDHFYQGKSPWDWMSESGYEYLDAGENLAIDFEELEPMHNAWMNSPTHKANIVGSKYKEIGIGIAEGEFEGHQTIIVVQMFGNPIKGKKVVPDSKEKAIENEVIDNFSVSVDEEKTVVGKDLKFDKETAENSQNQEDKQPSIWDKAKNGLKKLDNYMQNFIIDNYLVFYSYLLPNVFASTE